MISGFSNNNLILSSFNLRNGCPSIKESLDTNLDLQ